MPKTKNKSVSRDALTHSANHEANASITMKMQSKKHQLPLAPSQAAEIQSEAMRTTETIIAEKCRIKLADPQFAAVLPTPPPCLVCRGCGAVVIGLWKVPVTIEETHFQHKSLSAFVINPAVGCLHGCRFCYVPDVSTIKLTAILKELGVEDPDADWGKYLFVRPWDEEIFRRSLKKAEETSTDKLLPDGHRAILYSSTTDPFQAVVFGEDRKRAAELQKQLNYSVQRSLEMILEESTLRVRILTRSPLAKKQFGLMKKFGDRLLFGMSLPSTDHKLTDIYEPGAPHPKRRLETLQAAKEAGLNVYVAIAPTYPDCDEADLRKTLEAVKDLDPVTIFHEPINIRAENVERIRVHAEKNGQHMKTEVFETPTTWRKYAIEQLRQVQRIATELGVGDRARFPRMGADFGLDRAEYLPRGTPTGWSPERPGSGQQSRAELSAERRVGGPSDRQTWRHAAPQPNCGYLRRGGRGNPRPEIRRPRLRLPAGRNTDEAGLR